MKIKYFFAILGFIGVSMLVGAFFNYKKSSDFLSKSIEAEGIIIDVRSVRNLSEHKSFMILYKPLIRFFDLKGNSFEFHSSIGSASVSHYNVGDKITILYNSQAPDKARVKTFSSVWAESILLGIFGIILTSISVVFFLIKEKIKNT